MKSDHTTKSYYGEKLAELLRTERSQLLQYACYFLGDEDEAEDAVQEVSLQLLCRESCAGGKPLRSLKGYLYRCIHHFCISRLRQQRLSAMVGLDQAADCADELSHDVENEVARIHRWLSLIPEEQADVVRFRIYAGLAFAEIAEVLSVSLPTVKSRFLYGIRNLRKVMDSDSTFQATL